MAREREIPLAVLMRYFRVPTAEWPVDYPGRELLFGSCITNLSVSGVFIKTRRPLAEGSELTIAFRLPGSEQSITAEAVVRWCKHADPHARRGEADQGGMGLEFINISRRDQKAIERFVKSFLVRMRKQR